MRACGVRTPGRQRAWGSQKRPALGQLPPWEILTQEWLGRGGGGVQSEVGAKRRPYLQRLGTFQEGADHRPDTGQGELL